jgi:hypothetical protein
MASVLTFHICPREKRRVAFPGRVGIAQRYITSGRRNYTTNYDLFYRIYQVVIETTVIRRCAAIFTLSKGQVGFVDVYVACSTW